MAIDLAQFHQAFFEESFEGVALMESTLLRMEPEAVDADDINAIFRAAHSIKGSSGTFGFNEITSFTHVMESLLDELRQGRCGVTKNIREVLLRSVDMLRDMLSALSGKGALNTELVKSRQQELEGLLDSKGSDADRAEIVEAPSIKKSDEVIGWHLVFSPLPTMLRSGNDPLCIIRELDRLGRLEVQADISLLPRLEDFNPETCFLSWDLHLHAAVDQTLVNEIFAKVEGECDLAIMPIHADSRQSVGVSDERAGRTDNPSRAVANTKDFAVERRAGSDRRQIDRRLGERRVSDSSGAGSIRVDIHKIDHLVDMVGELVITQSMLSLLGENFHQGQLQRLRDGLDELERHTRELQESVMQIRMLPISFAFNRFPRLVHDLSLQLGKKIELRLAGETTELDKTVIEKIGDPLLHLVRNSVDHGIEMPSERIAAGKPETGTIELLASHTNGSIVLEIRDDGRGMDSDLLLRKAIEKGVIDKGTRLSEQQIHELVFQPGFSTAEKLTDLSGRGVGLDVVRQNINELGGSIKLVSNPGRSSAFIIKLPLTLAILEGQSVAVGDEVYIIPMSSIVESIQVKSDMVSLVAGREEVYRLRDMYLPVIRLHEVFGIEHHRAKRLSDGLLVIVEGEGRRCGILVDELIGQHQVVVKTLETNYQRVEGISGATILGDGSVALIVDISGIMRLAKAEPRMHLLRRSA